MDSLEKRSVAALAAVYAMRMLGLFMVLPVFVLLGQDLVGATPALLGFAMGAYGLSQALLQIPFGMLSDRIGRKRLIHFGLALFAVGSLLAGLSEHVYGVIAGRVLQGAGAIASVLMALLSDLTREENRTQAMATVGLSIGVAFAVSLFLGPMLGELAGLPGLFYLTAGLALAGMALVQWWVPTPARETVHPDAQPASRQLKRVLTDGRLLRLDFGIFALHLVLTALFLVVPVTLQDKAGLPSGHHWWVYLSVMALGFIAMVPFIIIGEKKRLMKPVLCGAVAMLTFSCLLLLVSPPTLPVLWGTLFLFFMAFNLLEATLPSLISKESPAGAKGTAMGVYSTSQFLGAFVGGAVGGVLVERIGDAAPFQMMLVVLTLWLLAALTMRAPSHTKSFVVQLRSSGDDSEGGIDQALRQLPGVDDVTILSGSRTAYLKVDQQAFDAKALDGLAFVKQ
ncbi:putative MFS family arabinose efflux permease [Tamilnaduibacter salinus]|uniref:Putative MFS family arabinose efflux permease n=1 Tax=Tamilnaduibacter salinus TaxID=1484056 RepID=A0A2U1CTZ5_9GAMM|nr:MFS transporter [Tamilnaduibacter salinus]PVY70305.1 putative MFS family arabinose efflux permease [Tamilnaduibacter salinus]